jgi:hypothetical protein
MTRIISVFALMGCVLSPDAAAQRSDLDALMGRVLASRDENWRKLQQYVLDERERIEFRGPARIRLWGEEREYTWFIRDGVFVRSPVRANGVALSESDRRKYEDAFVVRAKERERRAQEARAGVPADAPSDAPLAADGMLTGIRQPQFIDSAYFLKFKFEEGRYALVGREEIEGRAVLRIEYYPNRLFGHEQDDQSRRRREGRRDESEDVEAAMERAMNKVSLVTLWVEPEAAQIVKYTLANVDLDFLPAAWLVRTNHINAEMTMAQMFPGVWLPKQVQIGFSASVAVGDVEAQYRIDYHNYKEAKTSGQFQVIGQ